jgi:hypothetical protein
MPVTRPVLILITSRRLSAEPSEPHHRGRRPAVVPETPAIHGA